MRGGGGVDLTGKIKAKAGSVGNALPARGRGLEYDGLKAASFVFTSELV